MASNDFTNVPKIDSIYYVYELAEPPFQDEGYYVKIMFNDPIEERILSFNILVMIRLVSN